MRDHHTKLRLETVSRILPFLPEPVQARIVGPGKTWKWRDLGEVAKPHAEETRLIIGPANYAGQGYLWARAAETLPGVAAANLQRLVVADALNFHSDASVRRNVWGFSHLWQRRQQEALEEATHVIIESATPFIPDNPDDRWRLAARHVRDLQAKGVKVALLWHGTDIRQRSTHAAIEPYSPFGDVAEASASKMESVVRANHDLADELGVPEFVSTPDLLTFRPKATWLPTLSDPKRWAASPPEERAVPVVLHAPSSGRVKGTPAIREAMEQLQEEGVIEYREMTNVPSSQMPDHIADADIVIDSVGLGPYGVIALETMLSGRVAVGHVWESARDAVEQHSGSTVPVVEANPDTLGSVVRGLAGDYERRLELGKRGRDFVLAVHSEQAVAGALQEFLSS